MQVSFNPTLAIDRALRKVASSLELIDQDFEPEYDPPTQDLAIYKPMEYWATPNANSSTLESLENLFSRLFNRPDYSILNT